MPGKTYKLRGMVLRKTKLAEKDLIVTILDESGSLVRAVAKGARRPGGSYAARLELFSIVDLVLAQGRNLDVITGAALVDGASCAGYDVEQAACASVLAELLVTLAQEDLPHDRLYPMAEAAFRRIAEAESTQALAITCAAALKAFAYAGLRPCLAECALCGSPVGIADGADVPFSVSEGGVVCARCQRPPDAIRLDGNTLNWANVLMKARFEDVVTYDPEPGTLFAILQIIRQWSRFHASKNLKSLDFLLTSGLFQ